MGWEFGASNKGEEVEALEYEGLSLRLAGYMDVHSEGLIQSAGIAAFTNAHRDLLCES